MSILFAVVPIALVLGGIIYFKRKPKTKAAKAADSVEKPKERDKAPGIWIQNNFMEFPKTLDSIVGIYRSSELPFREELDALALPDLLYLFKHGAFRYGSEEKNRVFSVCVGKIRTNELSEFYDNYAHTGREYEKIIAERIIRLLKNHNDEADILELKKIVPEKMGELHRHFVPEDFASRKVTPQPPEMKFVKNDAGEQSSKEAV